MKKIVLITLCFVFMGFFLTQKPSAAETLSLPDIGIQSFSYTVTGAVLTSYEDKMWDTGQFGERDYKGRLEDSDTLRIHGTITTNSILDAASLSMDLGVGKSRSFCVNVNLNTNDQKDFDCSVPIPDMTPETLENIEKYGAYIKLYLDASYNVYDMDVVVIKADLTASQDKQYVIAPGYEEGTGEPWGFVYKIIINGKEVDGIDQTLLYNGSRIKTGPGVEIVLRTSYGAVTRVKENTVYEVEVREDQSPGVTDIIGRMVEGIGEFYWPKGYEGAKKFEVDTSRVAVGIKGTSFTVSQIDDISIVSVQDGVVQVTNLNTGSVSKVEAGSELTVSGNHSAAPAHSLTAVEYPSNAPPENNKVQVGNCSDVMVQPTLSVPSSDVGKTAQLLMYIYFPDLNFEIKDLPIRTATLAEETKFDLLPDAFDFTSLSGLKFYIYYGYIIGDKIEYNSYSVMVGSSCAN